MKNSMLKFNFGFSLLHLSLVVFGQLTIDLGKDTTFCKDLFAEPTSYIGTDLLIENGVEPYSYTWEAYYQIENTSLAFWASSFLNDTTAALPYFINYPLDDDWLKLHLTVEDAENKLAFDSINVRFSRFGYISDWYDVLIYEGDSIRFFDESFIGGGIPPLSFHWQPETFLEDASVLSSWCKPLKDIDYYLIASDSVGCVSEPHLMYVIDVIPLSTIYNHNIKKNLYQSGDIIFFENPTCERVKISILDLKGTIVFKGYSNNSQFDTQMINSPTGLYIIKIEFENHELPVMRFYKR